MSVKTFRSHSDQRLHAKLYQFNRNRKLCDAFIHYYFLFGDRFFYAVFSVKYYLFSKKFPNWLQNESKINGNYSCLNIDMHERQRHLGLSLNTFTAILILFQEIWIEA